ncbi:MAG: hypothetical protein JRD89_06710 [Deltaproteobacteria bacterium]|nr:hypothetical protein [Deltaproteobacteria bacterium]
MPLKLFITRQPPENLDAEVFIDDDTFWEIAVRKASLTSEWLKDRIYVRSKKGVSMADLGHMTKLIRVVFETLVRKGIDLTEIVRGTGRKSASDVETFLSVAQKAVNQAVNLDELFSEYEAKRIGVLRVCYANSELRFWRKDWLNLYAEGKFTEEAVKKGMIADDLFCFSVREVDSG